LFTWGSGSQGQLGHGNTNDLSIPQQVKKVPKSIHHISGGGAHTLIATKDHFVFSCGSGEYGQLGTNSTSNSLELAEITTLKGLHVALLSCGWSHSVALLENGCVYVWGNASYYQLGLGTETNEDTKQFLETTPPNSKKINTTLKIPDQLIPKLLPSLNGVIFVACGMRHTAAVTKDGRVFTWGHGKFGQLGHNDKLSKPSPTQIPSEWLYQKQIIMVACGARHTTCLTGTSVTLGTKSSCLQLN